MDITGCRAQPVLTAAGGIVGWVVNIPPTQLINGLSTLFDQRRHIERQGSAIIINLDKKSLSIIRESAVAWQLMSQIPFFRPGISSSLLTDDNYEERLPLRYLRRTFKCFLIDYASHNSTVPAVIASQFHGLILDKDFYHAYWHKEIFPILIKNLLSFGTETIVNGVMYRQQLDALAAAGITRFMLEDYAVTNLADLHTLHALNPNDHLRTDIT